MRLRARCVERLETAADGRLATTYVTWKDLEELGLLEGDQGREMVEVAIGLEGTEVGILFRGLAAGRGHEGLVPHQDRLRRGRALRGARGRRPQEGRGLHRSRTTIWRACGAR